MYHPILRVRHLFRLSGDFIAYAVVNLLVFLVLPAPHIPRGLGTADAPPAVFRAFSGFWMAFYAAAVGVLYAAVAGGKRDPARG